MAGSFKKDVLPLFRRIDIDHMKPMRVKLDNFTWMSDPKNAQKVYETLETKWMPLDGPYWTDEQLKILSDWMNVDPKFQP